MTDIRLPYGRRTLAFSLPDSLNTETVIPRYLPGLKNEKGAVASALKNPIGAPPLSELVKPRHRVGIVFSDITRATPYDRILPALFEELKIVPDENITLFNATGTHRQNTREELYKILGRETANRFKIIQNNALDKESHVYLGATKRGTEISVLKDFMDCDVRIITGFIEPHFFAGFSGGGKAVIPGLASMETVLANHSVKNIDDSKANWGITEGNPVWEDIMEAAEMCMPLFLVNVALNRDKRITSVFAGNLRKAHAEGCAFIKDVSMRSVPEPYDIVVTSNSGYPLDLNLYQTVKGMSAAAQIVKPGGSIVIASDCWDGIPEYGEYGRLLTKSKSPEELLEKIREPGFVCRDSWQAQIHALICLKADVFLYSNNLTDKQITESFLKVSRSIENTVEKLIKNYGNSASVCILPEGPMTIPYIQ